LFRPQTPIGGKKSYTDPKLLADGGARTAAFALQNIHFSNGRYWRKADIGELRDFDIFAERKWVYA